MKQVVILVPKENVKLDSDRIGDLYHRVGDAAAENVICRAMEELAVRLSYTERLYKQNDAENLRKSLHSLELIADQIGMGLLAQVARDTAHCLEGFDPVGSAATLARLLRIGERSLMAVCDIRDLSI